MPVVGSRRVRKVFPTVDLVMAMKKTCWWCLCSDSTCLTTISANLVVGRIYLDIDNINIGFGIVQYLCKEIDTLDLCLDVAFEYIECYV